MSYHHPYKHPFDVFPNDRFVSIVIPTLSRPFYLERAVKTLHEQADMPFELIVVDDGSDPKTKQVLFGMRDKISTVVSNYGINMGLNEAANRGIALASSRNVIFTTDDCWFVKPCLKDLCNVLSKPYVGFICAANDIGPLANNSVCDVNGTRFAISNYLGGGISQAFRKEVWKEVGGWDLRSTSGQSDNVFLFKILRAGYWKAIMEGRDRVKCANFEEESTYVPTAGLMRGHDCSLPKLFGMDPTEQIILGHHKRESCQYWVDGERTIPNRESFDSRPNPVAGLNDIEYWFHYFQDIFGNTGTSHNVHQIDWNVATIHGQDKWKDEIFKDFGVV